MDRGEIPMEHRRREFTMEPRRTSPMQPRQRQKSHKYSSTTSPYNMDRTARIKATSSVATQTDSFQDPSEEFSELVYINSFQDPSYMVTFDSFQDHLRGLDGKSSKLTPLKTAQKRNLGNWCRLTHFRTISQMAKVYFFQDPALEGKHWKLVEKMTPFKTPVNHNQIDSFQDPMFICSTKTVQIDSFQDPCIGLHSVFILNGRHLQVDSVKSPWETTLRKLFPLGPFYTVNFRLIARPL